MRKHYLYYIAALVAAITFAVYLVSLRNNFIVEWDDGAYVFDNPHIRQLNISFLKWAFFGFHSDNWHPVTWISHALDYSLWGLNPLGHHLTNITLHAANTFVVFLLVTRLLKVFEEKAVHNEPSDFLRERMIGITGAVTALLFGLHPVHVESAAWVAERKDLLCALFFLLSILMYTNFVSSKPVITQVKSSNPLPPAFPKWSEGRLNRYYLFCLGFFALALLSKPMAVTLPAVLLILDWHPFAKIRSLRTLKSALAEKLPFFALSLLLMVLTVLAQRMEGAVKSMAFAPLSTRVLVACKSIISYLGKMIWPLDLSPFYPYPKNVSPFSIAHLLVLVLVIGITICAVVARKRKIWLSAWSYYVVTLLPVLGIVQVGEQSMADRYTYLPSLGPFLFIGLVAATVWGKADSLKKWGLTVKTLGIVVAVIATVSMTCLTVKQIGVWRDSIGFWSYVIRKEPARIPFAYARRALAFEREGQPFRAIADYDHAISLDSSYSSAYIRRGQVYEMLGVRDKAIADYDKAIAINPDYDKTFLNRVRALKSGPAQ